MDKQALKELQKHLKYRFRNPDLLVQALTHPSYVQGTEQKDFHNQRLEFLGDAVLGMIVADALFEAFPNEREGFLTQARAAICHGKSLSRLADDLELGHYLRLGSGEQRSQARLRSQITGDLIEAIIGAVYLDGGYKAVRKLVLRWIKAQLTNPERDIESINHKGSLQEWSQARYGKNRFNYELVDTHGPGHARQFTVSLMMNNRELAKATAYSKKEAESRAAQNLLEQLRVDPNMLDAFDADETPGQEESPQT